jgi:glutaredoxin-related protein
MLSEEKVKYSSFNILADEDVRQGKLLNWDWIKQWLING